MKARDRSPALARLLTEAQAAMQHDVSSRRKALPGDGSWPTEAEVTDLLVQLARTKPDQRDAFRNRLQRRQRVVLAHYGVESAGVALGERSRARLRLGLIALALKEDGGDYRDYLCAVARHHIVASELGMSPAELFAEAAGYANRDTADLLSKFGRRTDVKPESFGIRSL
jgi:hypothetical protein